ncbi:junctional adhesion molecule 2A-like [Vespula maculifrons]|uniref:Junctional adhesion molecule 2A-like n=1 Tax=Vespula maculifrons TaxID=7453 RepID=A0ABD2CKX0_VESMC
MIKIKNKSKLLLVIIIFLLDAICAVHVQLIAPRYVKSGSTATLYCNHSVPEDELYKIEFIKDDEKIFQYIKERNPPFVIPGINGVFMEYSENGTTIKLRNVSFLASGVYSCAVSMSTPIYTKPSDNVQMKVIVPQTENPKITFEKSVYMVGENLEANCSSSAALPVPHLTCYSYWKTIPLVQYFSIDMGHMRFLRFHGLQLAKWKMGDVNIHCKLSIDPRLTCTLQEYTFYFEEDRHGNRENTALVNSPFYADSTADHPRCLRLRLGLSMKQLVDVTLVHHYPHTQHKDLLSATAKLMIEVSALHAGDNGYLDISCHSTIPDYPMNHEEYADVKKKTVSIQITLASIPSSFAVRSMHELILAKHTIDVSTVNIKENSTVIHANKDPAES